VSDEVKMKMSTNKMVDNPVSVLMSDSHKKYEIPMENIYEYYMGHSELIKILLRMYGWWSKKSNESIKKVD